MGGSQPCVFPFTYENKTYTTCAPSDRGRFGWCFFSSVDASTTTTTNTAAIPTVTTTVENAGATHVTSPSTLATPASCSAQRVGGDGKNGSCILPFTCANKTYTTCAPSNFGSGFGWCSFRSVYASSAWGCCTASCERAWRAWGCCSASCTGSVTATKAAVAPSNATVATTQPPTGVAAPAMSTSEATQAPTEELGNMTGIEEDTGTTQAAMHGDNCDVVNGSNC